MDDEEVTRVLQKGVMAGIEVPSGMLDRIRMLEQFTRELGDRPAGSGLYYREPSGVARFLEAGSELVVGRDVVGGVDKLMSRQHFRVYLQDGVWMAEDMGSRNGSELNGKPLTRSPLADGDTLQAGRMLFVFSEDAE